MRSLLDQNYPVVEYRLSDKLKKIMLFNRYKRVLFHNCGGLIKILYGWSYEYNKIVCMKCNYSRIFYCMDISLYNDTQFEWIESSKLNSLLVSEAL